MAFRFVPGRTTRRAASGAVRLLRATAKANAAAARRTGALMQRGAEALKTAEPAHKPPGASSRSTGCGCMPSSAARDGRWC